MKNKKGAFTSTSTGYGKHTHRHFNNTNKKNDKPDKTPDKVKDVSKQNVENNNELNSGFGEYLRSPQAVEMMKLFVFANTIMLIITMAWPHVKEQYIMLMSWLSTFQDDI